MNNGGFLKAGPRKIFSFKPVRSAKEVADPCCKACKKSKLTDTSALGMVILD